MSKGELSIPKDLPVLEYLQECFHVDFIKGILVWKFRPLSHFSNIGVWKRINTIYAGTVAGSLTPKDYLKVSLGDRKYYLCHKIIFKMFHKYDEEYLDHLDGNTLNNSISNLRPSTLKSNGRNKKMSNKNNTKVTGVAFRERVVDGRVYGSFIATWRTFEGKPRGREFGILKLGHDNAFRLACEYRAKMIEELNAQGMGYTERHGKPLDSNTQQVL